MNHRHQHHRKARRVLTALLSVVVLVVSLPRHTHATACGNAVSHVSLCNESLTVNELVPNTSLFTAKEPGEQQDSVHAPLLVRLWSLLTTALDVSRFERNHFYALTTIHAP